VTEPLLVTEMDCTSVHEAVMNDHAACLHFQLARTDIIPLSVSSDHHGSTPLHWIKHNSTPFCYEAFTAPLLASMPAAFVRAVVGASAQFVPCSHERVTALHLTKYDWYASNTDSPQRMRCHKCVRALIAAGADPLALDHDPSDVYETPKQAITVADMLHVATRRQQQQGDDFDIDEWLIIATALQAAGLNFQDAKVLLATVSRAHCELNQQPSSSHLRLLLACGADPLTLRLNSYTALHAAVTHAAHPVLAEGEHMVADIIQILYDAGGAELLSATTEAGETALHLAVAWPARMQQLCDLGADIGALTNWWQTPLHAACAQVNTEQSIQLLLQRGASAHTFTYFVADRQMDSGWMPIHSAAVYGSVAAVQMLIGDAGVSIEALTEGGCSPLWLVARYCRPDYDTTVRLQELVALGAHVTFYSPAHGSLLHAAAQGGNVAVVQWLFEQGLTLAAGDQRHRTAAGLTPLHCAATAGNTDVVQLLIERGSDLTAVSVAGDTPLRASLQAPTGAAACMTLLIKAGSDVLDTTTTTRLADHYRLHMLCHISVLLDAPTC
jgi:ankyrin repeat protein